MSKGSFLFFLVQPPKCLGYLQSVVFFPSFEAWAKTFLWFFISCYPMVFQIIVQESDCRKGKYSEVLIS